MARKKAVKKVGIDLDGDGFVDITVDAKILKEMSQEPLKSYIVLTYFKGHASRKDFHNVIVGETLELTVDQAKAFAAHIKEA